jgi:glycosyltransferase involved in cell wall biosynthesis
LKSRKPWEGWSKQKPWDYNVSVAIPVLDTIETLKVVVKLLRLQTERPFIIVIDTGSTDELLAEVAQLRAVDLEVHSLRLNGVRHPSDFPAMAMDVAFTVCRTRYLFATHADCFLMRQDVLERMLRLCQTTSPVVGHELSPRHHADWKGMVGHTCLMLDMHVMDDIGAGWSLRRLARQHGIENHEPSSVRPNWPDTELLLNYTLRKHGIAPYLTGTEENFARNRDEYIDHCRSLTASFLYNREYYEKARAWAEDAMNDARIRIANWSAQRRPEHTEETGRGSRLH